ncbi:MULTISPECIES: hypothetical protein [unclassified Mycobacterium]|uniref:hypothetical protein n=1 Tax=unclassified Mycobacterium TaxID=2642494 RepID=UPI000A58A939|nr:MULTISPECIES: hypothetical protein [unclassified Mycobacterium]
MKSRARKAIVLFSGATVLTLAAGFGGGEVLSNTTTPMATPTSTVAPAPPAKDGPGAPATSQPTRDFDGPHGDTGCIPHINC